MKLWNIAHALLPSVQIRLWT